MAYRAVWDDGDDLDQAGQFYEESVHEYKPWDSKITRLEWMTTDFAYGDGAAKETRVGLEVSRLTIWESA